MNLDNIRKLRDHLAELAKNPTPEFGFSMENWFAEHSPSECVLHEGFCGTSACLAGHAWLLLGNPDDPHEAYKTDDVYSAARDLLGLNSAEATHVFYGHWGFDSSVPLDELTLEDALKYLNLVLKEDDVFVSPTLLGE